LGELEEIDGRALGPGVGIGARGVRSCSTSARLGRLPSRRAVNARSRLGLVAGALGQLQLQAQRRERRAQLVRGIGDEAPLLPRARLRAGP
jgi:hypothetical protein